MHQIKRLPQDFIVKEISNLKIKENGQYAYYLLKKTSYTTIDALQVLSDKFKIPLKNMGFAGNKDKNAITEQKISIFRGSKNFENAKFNNIGLKYIGNGKEPISLGDLKGNEFTIIIRNLDGNQIKKIKKFQNKRLKIPNLYGSQRFSKNNHIVGKAIIERDFKKAIKLILENNGLMEEKIKNYLQKNKNNYIEAIRLIPLKTRRLFVHSYQSFLFNKMILQYLDSNSKLKNIKIPIIGFDFELNSVKNASLKNIFKKTMKKEKLNPRDFIISQMPELTSEGGFRDLFFELNDLKILEVGNDELNQNKQKIKINFTLPKSCYATVALEFFFQQHQPQN
ncbi:tRNA pseudouridine(13) synthase TruD [Candidatus Woesearchaeota archaeon]|nr:tRNA pseudouridine(13) synthase TruD [Candidatus Woesearchaeota archaeon]HLG24296.1 tRNA pseudouridine(13) synthase TruD [Candidatus Nanoarchaeia archaeon]